MPMLHRSRKLAPYGLTDPGFAPVNAGSHVAASNPRMISTISTSAAKSSQRFMLAIVSSIRLIRCTRLSVYTIEHAGCFGPGRVSVILDTDEIRHHHPRWSGR